MSQLLQYTPLSRQSIERWPSNNIQRHGLSSSNNSFVEQDVDSNITNVKVANTVNPIPVSLIDNHLLPSKYVGAINRYNTIKH
jgi:hypothetical protein